MKKALLIMMLICPFILGQDLAKNDNKKASDLETAFLRNQRDGAAYEAFLAKMQSKYACSGCQITVAPDGKTLVIKPKSAQ